MKRFKPFAAISGVMILWGLSFLSIKISVIVLSPMSLALSRFIIASVILYSFMKITEPNTKLSKRDIPLMALSGIVGITVYFYFENNGVKLTTASTASIIIGAIPVLTVIADYIFCGNKIDWVKGLGVGLSFFGVYLIVWDSGGLNLGSRYFVGNLYMLGATLAWVAYSLVTRPLAGRYSRLAITTYQTLFGTLGILPFALLETNRWEHITATIIWNVVFLGVFCSAVGYYLYVYALDELGVDIASLFINLIPVVTVIASFLILDEKITTVQLIGGGIVVGSVYVADLSNLIRFRVGRRTGGRRDPGASG